MAQRGAGRGGWAAFVPAMIWAAVALWIGSRPYVDVPVETDAPIDKFGHLVVYGVLGLGLAWGWLRNGRRPAVWLLIGAGVVVGIIDELVQMTIPERTAEVVDVVADAVGVMAGFWLGTRWLRRFGRQGAG